MLALSSGRLLKRSAFQCFKTRAETSAHMAVRGTGTSSPTCKSISHMGHKEVGLKENRQPLEGSLFRFFRGLHQHEPYLPALYPFHALDQSPVLRVRTTDPSRCPLHGLCLPLCCYFSGTLRSWEIHNHCWPRLRRLLFPWSLSSSPHPPPPLASLLPQALISVCLLA